MAQTGSNDRTNPIELGHALEHSLQSQGQSAFDSYMEEMLFAIHALPTLRNSSPF